MAGSGPVEPLKVEPLTVNQTLTAVPGMTTVFAPVPRTRQQHDEPYIPIIYENVTLPAEHLTWLSDSVIGGNSATTWLKRLDPIWWVVTKIEPVATGASSPDPNSGRPSPGAASRSTGKGSACTGVSTSEPSTTGDSSANNNAVTAVAGVMGGLFAITLVALLFLIFKLRKGYSTSFVRQFICTLD